MAVEPTALGSLLLGSCGQRCRPPLKWQPAERHRECAKFFGLDTEVAAKSQRDLQAEGERRLLRHSYEHKSDVHHNRFKTGNGIC